MKNENKPEMRIYMTTIEKQTAANEATVNTEELSPVESLIKSASDLCLAHKFDEAEGLFTKALTLCEAEHGRRSLPVATCLECLGNLYNDRAHFAKAARFHGEACVTRQTLLGKHPKTAASLVKYSVALMGDGQWGQATEGFTMALTMYKKIAMLHSPEADACRQHLVACKEASGCVG